MSEVLLVFILKHFIFFITVICCFQKSSTKESQKIKTLKKIEGEEQVNLKKNLKMYITAYKETCSTQFLMRQVLKYIEC